MPKGVHHVGWGFWLPTKSVSNILSCCFVCMCVHNWSILQWKQYQSQIWSCWHNIYFWKWKRHGIRPLKMDTLTVSAFDAFIHVHDESKHYLSHWFVQRRYCFTQWTKNQLSLSFVFGVRGSEMSLDPTLRVLKCFMTSIHRQSSKDLIFSFSETLPQSQWYITASGTNVLFYCQMSGEFFLIYFAILHNIVTRNNVQHCIRLNKQKGREKKAVTRLHYIQVGSHVTHPSHLLWGHGRMEEMLWHAKGVWLYFWRP